VEVEMSEDGCHKKATERPLLPHSLLASGGVSAAGALMVLVEALRSGGSFPLFFGIGVLAAGAPLFIVQLTRHFKGLVARLRESRDIYFQLVEQSIDGITIFREDRFLFANRALQRMVGLDEAEILAAPLSRFVPEEHRATIRERHARRMRGESVPTLYEIELIDQEGGRIPVELAPERVDYKGAPASQTVIRDLRGRRELEARLVHSARIAAIGELAAGVAHQLNNPMTGILNLAQLMDERCDEADPRSKIANKIVAAATDATGIIRSLLRFSRQPQRDHAPVKLDALLRDVLTISEKHLAHSDIEVSVAVDEGLDTSSCGNADALGQVLLNLIQNAHHAIGQGGHIHFRLEPFFEEDERFIALRVRDDGHGIPPDVLERIFDPFFTTKSRDRGTGLGLSLARQIVHQHGGRVWARSQEGQWSEFTVLMPADEHAEGDDPPGEPRASRCAKRQEVTS
jgi:PAS domain S-box-containing protein